MKALVLVMASIFFAPVEALAQPAEKYTLPEKLKILSWNIYMLPSVLGNGKAVRADVIGRMLASSDYDVIVFQEAFHKRSRKIISRQLEPAFSFQSGPANRKLFSLKANSGIWIFSKYPILHSAAIIFETRAGIDALSRKGALLAELDVNGQQVQIVGTHLQNMGGDWLRHSQCVELYNRLLKPNERLDVPQVICGDFNIDRYRSAESYQYMLNVLGAADGESGDSVTYSYDRVLNDLTTEPGSNRDLIDYVLVRHSAFPQTDCHIRRFRHPWRNGFSDLSDHFALEAELFLKTSAPLVAVASK